MNSAVVGHLKFRYSNDPKFNSLIQQFIRILSAPECTINVSDIMLAAMFAEQLIYEKELHKRLIETKPIILTPDEAAQAGER